ncbi:MAG: hypothetical protein LUI06_00550 [Ruminococcus sp.]|nr:hypothetical protein [Ruminococcus sp.]
MNTEMAYLLGMVSGNGEIIRGSSETTISIEIPHKKLETEEFHDVKLYVKASLSDIQNVLEPLIGSGLSRIQNEHSTIISFSKPNSDYLIREILRFTGSATTHDNMRIHHDVFNFSTDEKKMLLRGFADVTGYVRRSNAFIVNYKHRVYLEVPNNWFMVVDICNLLKDIDIPIQSIDWAHPNMRDGKLKKYNQGSTNFWKKEHQIKIYANEFLPIGFSVIHKNQALEKFSDELIAGFKADGKVAKNVTHIYYWEGKGKNKVKPSHPGEYDVFLPTEIRGKHYNSWKEIAKDLGYGK